MLRSPCLRHSLSLACGPHHSHTHFKMAKEQGVLGKCTYHEQKGVCCTCNVSWNSTLTHKRAQNSITGLVRESGELTCLLTLVLLPSAVTTCKNPHTGYQLAFSKGHRHNSCTLTSSRLEGEELEIRVLAKISDK